MHPRLAFLILPYTRAEFPGWARVMRGFGFGAALGGAERMRPEWKQLPKAIARIITLARSKPRDPYAAVRADVASGGAEPASK